MITLAGVTRRFDDANVVGPVDLEIPTGARVALIGPSGCGKSTLLRLVVGLAVPDAGHVAVEGARLEPASLSVFRRRVGYLTQDAALFPHLRCVDNVALRMREAKRPSDVIEARLDELASLVRLSRDLLRRYPFQLSGGQRQRVALMRALALGPSYLLLDEPLAALDPISRRELQEELGALVRTLSATTLVVTHDLREAELLADRAVLLRAGRIEQDDDFPALRATPKSDYVRDFLRAAGP